MFFIGRAFKDPHSPDYMPLQKVEDMLRGQARMLGSLVEELCKRAEKVDAGLAGNLLNKARGVWSRNTCQTTNQAVKDSMVAYPYNPSADRTA